MPEQQLAQQLAQQLLDLVDDGIAMPILLIDGRAGSGKSTLAAAVQNEFFKIGESTPRIIHMDDLYPGWDGLAAGAEYLQRAILNPLSNRIVAHYQRYDWTLSERTEWREFAGGTPLIVEGCGAINSNSINHANLSIWLDADEATRYERWVKREGSTEFWAEWAAQELDFYARERSRDLAQMIS